MAKLSTYVLNLERHGDRLARMAEQLDEQGIKWERFLAVDGSSLSDEELDRLVAPKGPIPRMTRGARACTASHFEILRSFLETGNEYALVFEDDAILAATLSEDLENLLKAANFDVLNLNRQTPKGMSKRLVVRRRSLLSTGIFSVHDLVGIHYGTAGYLISAQAARAVLKLYPYPNIPIDHILFNPNISKLFRRLKVQQLFPALVRPSEELVSSIQNEPVDKSTSILNRAKRASAEVAIAPRLLIGLLLGIYSVKVLDFETPKKP